MFLYFESLIMILSSLSLASLSPPSSIGLTMLLFSSLTDTCNNTFGTNYGVVCPSTVILMQLLALGDWNILV